MTFFVKRCQARFVIFFLLLVKFQAFIRLHSDIPENVAQKDGLFIILYFPLISDRTFMFIRRGSSIGFGVFIFITYAQTKRWASERSEKFIL